MGRRDLLGLQDRWHRALLGRTGNRCGRQHRVAWFVLRNERHRQKAFPERRPKRWVRCLN
jgi:hypothetical protein